LKAGGAAEKWIELAAAAPLLTKSMGRYLAQAATYRAPANGEPEAPLDAAGLCLYLAAH